MGDLAHPKTTNTTMNVVASTLRKAVAKAEKIERAMCAELTKEEGETFKREKAISVEFLCELDE